MKNVTVLNNNSATPGANGPAGPAGFGGPGGAGGFADGGAGTQAPSGGSGSPGAVGALVSVGPNSSTAASSNLLVLDQALASLGDTWSPDNPVNIANAIAQSGSVPTVTLKVRLV